MKSGIYHVYLLLGKDGQLAVVLKATCEYAAGYVYIFDHSIITA